MSTVIPDVSRFMTSPQPAGTENTISQQTMIRVKDPLSSLDFYCKGLGMRLIHYADFPQWKFSVYFVAPVFHDLSAGGQTDTERWNTCMNTAGCIELTWNHGSEFLNGPVYNTGNGSTIGMYH